MQRSTEKIKGYILTGAPRSGKTTIVKAIEQRGYRTFAEPIARIARELNIKSDIRKANPREKENFLAQCYWAFVNDYTTVVQETCACFCDRGLPDIQVLAEMLGVPLTSEMVEGILNRHYSQKVFLFEPISEQVILAESSSRPRFTDSEKRHIESILRITYQEMGYQIIKVPFGPIEEKVEFVLGHLI
jgi:predicted ATPase